MILALLRVLFGFAIACLAAALVQVAFVITPAEIVSLDPGAIPDRLGGAGLLTLLTATHVAIFSAPFGLVVAAVGEWQALRSWIFYTLAGMAIALAGFVAQYASEVGTVTIVNNYALQAYVTTGFVAGFVYWAFSGRYAGGADDRGNDLSAKEQAAAATPISGKPSNLAS
jgi:hypothetical protein